MELAKYKACICEGSAENAIMVKLSKAYEHKVDVINVITAPEIEMLIIFNEDKYKEFKKSGKKPSDFCKEDLKMTGVKAYSFVKDYFGHSGKWLRRRRTVS